MLKSQSDKIHEDLFSLLEDNTTGSHGHTVDYKITPSLSTKDNFLNAYNIIDLLIRMSQPQGPKHLRTRLHPPTDLPTLPVTTPSTNCHLHCYDEEMAIILNDSHAPIEGDNMH